MKELYIDFDGVILDTLTKLYKDKEEYFKRKITQEEMSVFCSIYPWEELIIDENIINNAIEAIQKIINSDRFNVSVLTHINSLNEGVLKINYLRRFFKDITIILCPKVISKTKIVHSKDAILVDDYSGNLREWKSEGGIPVKFSVIPEESDEFEVIDNLTRILELF